MRPNQLGDSGVNSAAENPAKSKLFDNVDLTHEPRQVAVIDLASKTPDLKSYRIDVEDLGW